MELDPARCALIAQNARVYDVSSSMTIVVGDAFSQTQLISRLGARVVTVSPPWGGVDYARSGFRLKSFAIGGKRFLDLVRELADIKCVKIIYAVLPRRFALEEDEIFDKNSENCEHSWKIERRDVRDENRLVYTALLLTRENAL